MKKLQSLAVVMAIAASLLTVSAAPASANITETTDVSVSSLRSNILSRFDANRNGQLDPTETVHRDIPSADISLFAANSDADADGVVTRAEIEATIAVYDTNGDGHLSDAELVRFIGDNGDAARTN